MARAIEAEIERNYAAFSDMLSNLLPNHAGKYAVMSEQNLAGLFDTPGDAARYGHAKFGDLSYSIQLVTDEPVDLGFYSHAVSTG